MSVRRSRTLSCCAFKETQRTLAGAGVAGAGAGEDNNRLCGGYPGAVAAAQEFLAAVEHAVDD